MPHENYMKFTSVSANGGVLERIHTHPSADHLSLLCCSRRAEQSPRAHRARRAYCVCRVACHRRSSPSAGLKGGQRREMRDDADADKSRHLLSSSRHRPSILMHCIISYNTYEAGISFPF